MQFFGIGLSYYGVVRDNLQYILAIYVVLVHLSCPTSAQQHTFVGTCMSPNLLVHACPLTVTVLCVYKGAVV